MSNIIHIKTVSQVTDFLGLPKPNHPLVSVIRRCDIKKGFSFSNLRFVIDLYQITLKAHFHGTLKYGRNSYDFQEGTMIFTSPGQTLSFEGNHEEDTSEEGWVVLFHPDLIRNSELGKNIHTYAFFSYDVNEALHLSNKEKESLGELVTKVETEINQNIDKHSQKLIIANIELILDYCLRYYDRQFYTRTNLNQDIVSKFERLLLSYYASDKPINEGIPSVRYCGKALNMSPNYLSDLLKKETGRNAKEHIHYHVIDLAKTSLLNSNEPISGIAFDLGFEYPQHFAKIFKSKTGMSPTEFRNLN